MIREISAAILLIIIFGCLSVPAETLEVGAGRTYNDFNSALLNSSDGDSIVIYGGHYSGNFRIEKSLAIIGIGDPVIDGGGNGTVILINAPGVSIKGLTIQNSGKLLDKEDAGILVRAGAANITGNVLKSVLFGIYFKKADSGVVTNNIIEGKKELDIPRRGDLFRAWYCRNLLISNNQFRSGRDVIIWFTESSTIENNNMSDARYGLHFMYSSNCRIIKNVMSSNSVGIYLMYSKKLLVSNNLITNNRGATGFGIGLKDLDNVKLSENVIADNRVGIFIDNSPRNSDAFMTYYKNLVAYNETGIEVISTLENSEFNQNCLMENYQQTALSSGQNSDNDYWEQNYWSDYSGYDSGSDGTGDIPYRADQVIENLIDEKPNLKIFLYSPAINTLNYAARAFPIFTTAPKLIDKKPLIRPLPLPQVPGQNIEQSPALLFLSLLLTAVSGLMILLFSYRNKLVHNSTNHFSVDRK